MSADTLAIPVPGVAQGTFECEAHGFQREPLSMVVGTGDRFDSPYQLRCEQVLNELAMRFSPVAAAPCRSEERDPDVERRSGSGGRMMDRVPADVTDELASFVLNRQQPTVVTNPTVGAESPLVQIRLGEFHIAPRVTLRRKEH